MRPPPSILAEPEDGNLTSKAWSLKANRVEAGVTAGARDVRDHCFAVDARWLRRRSAAAMKLANSG